MIRARVASALAAAIAAVLVSVPLAAQTKLTLAGCSCNMGNATVAEYTAGEKVSATAVTYTVAATFNLGTKTTSVYVRANAATMNNGKSISECQWRRNDLATWNNLTTSDVLIESRPLTGLFGSWNNSFFLRCGLDWVNDPVGLQSVGLTFTLKVT